MGKSRLINGTGLWTSFNRRWGDAVKTVKPYRNGIVHGIVREYGRFKRDGGIGVSVTEFVRGSAHGFSRTYDEDGTLRGEAYMVDGRVHGVYRMWDRDGELVEGYPKYFVCEDGLSSRKVSREEYLQAAMADAELRKTLTLP